MKMAIPLISKRIKITGVSLLALFPQLKQLLCAAQCQDITLTGICEDSRAIVDGDLFVARDGEHFKGEDYIEAAANNGAFAALVCGTQERVNTADYSIPVISLNNLEHQLGSIAAQVFNNCIQQLNIIAITGTNGKTSCAHFLAQALNSLAVNTFIIGTLGNGHPDALEMATSTTPNACQLHTLLAKFHSQGAQTVVMEVSSHALAQGRVNGIAFQAAAFTNLSRDHLDYHGSMQAYGAVKSRLFTDFKVEHRVLNLADDFNRSLARRLQSDLDVSIATYSEDQNIPADFVASGLNLQSGIHFTMRTKRGDVDISTALIGKFNVANLLLCIALLSKLGFSNQQIISSVKQLKTVPGRMQNILCEQLPSHPLVVVDYAHTPDALQKALQACRVHCRGQLYVVFGCGGDRDVGKRAEMAQLAENFADHLIVTSDNPRTEDPHSIIQMILKGLSKTAVYTVNQDRRAAIDNAINLANNNDVVLVAGKGHEDYQEIMGVKQHFSDAQVLLDSLKSLVEKHSLSAGSRSVNRGENP